LHLDLSRVSTKTLVGFLQNFWLAGSVDEKVIVVVLRVLERRLWGPM
jgi:hypothetical protein